MKFIIGKKIDMTQVWKDDKVAAVTRLQAGPCIVTQLKDKTTKDRYEAVQLAFSERKEKNIKKPQKGHMKKAGVKAMFLREFRINIEASDDAMESKLKIGDVINVSTFEPGDKIKVVGVSKGKGFQGVVKRHGFHGQDKTHGTKDQLRMPGSIGAAGPAHVFKGIKMPGRMGADRVTIAGLKIIEVDEKNNILLVKGAVPGARNGLVLISGEGELKVSSKKEEVKTEKNNEKKVESNDKELGIMNKELGDEAESKIKEDNKKVENKEENIEEVVVRAAEKVGENKEINKEDAKEKK